MKILKLILFFYLFTSSVYSQETNKEYMYVNPMITIGYSFGSGFTYGIDLTYGFAQFKAGSNVMNFAISTKYYFINLNGYANRALAVNLIAENEYIRIGGGFAEIKRKWGFQNRNVSRTYGPATDFGLHFGDRHIPWIGLKTIFPKYENDWYERPNSISLYTYYRLDNILIIDK